MIPEIIDIINYFCDIDSRTKLRNIFGDFYKKIYKIPMSTARIITLNEALKLKPINMGTRFNNCFLILKIIIKNAPTAKKMVIKLIESDVFWKNMEVIVQYFPEGFNSHYCIVHHMTQYRQTSEWIGSDNYI
jgi:hypothetical protein